MEFCDGNLKDYLTSETRSSEEKFNMLVQITDGLKFVHLKKLAHKNLKPSNILIKLNPKSDATIKISDVGIASLTSASDFMSPEMLNETCGFDIIRKSVDIWSLGMIAYWMFTGKTIDMDEVVKLTFRSKPYIEKHLSFISQILQDLIEQMLSYHSNERPKIEDVHKRLNGTSDLLKVDLRANLKVDDETCYCNLQ